jgi:hypothetical protein
MDFDLCVVWSDKTSDGQDLTITRVGYWDLQVFIAYEGIIGCYVAKDKTLILNLEKFNGIRDLKLHEKSVDRFVHYRKFLKGYVTTQFIGNAGEYYQLEQWTGEVFRPWFKQVYQKRMLAELSKNLEDRLIGED